MGIRIGDIISRFELMTGSESQVERIRRRFVDRDEALRFLQTHASAEDVAAEVRRWSFDLGIRHQTNRGLLMLLANAIDTGEIWVAEMERSLTRKGGSGGGGGGKKVDPVPPRPGPKPKPKPVAELVVTVKDLLGKPVEGATVTAGALGTRTTGKDGIADFGKVTPGSYDISASKPGHGKIRNGAEEKDEKKGVSVPDGSKTAVTLIQHPECANVAFFEGSKTRDSYFGFDHKTNFKKGPKPEYWTPVPAKGSLTMPTNRLTLDAARWVSVAVGKEAELEINYAFLGPDCIPCLANSTFVVSDPKVAEVVTAKISAKQAVFKIKGKAEGETSLKVVCDGHDIGWFHIWCREHKELLVDVATIVTNRTTAATYDIAALQTVLDEIYRQLLVTLNLKDIGTIDLTDNADVVVSEDTEYPAAGGKFQQSSTEDQDKEFLSMLDVAAMAAVAARPMGAVKGRPGARRLYWYVPDEGAQWAGMVPSIGHSAAFVYKADGPFTRNSAAHEIGHTMKLRHPSDTDGSAQFAHHNLITCNHTVEDIPATNTEPAVVKPTEPDNAKAPNVMASDPTNLMGYWYKKPARKHLRYHQWQAADRS